MHIDKYFLSIRQQSNNNNNDNLMLIASFNTEV